jgi:hypothetical protein
MLWSTVEKEPETRVVWNCVSMYVYLMRFRSLPAFDMVELAFELLSCTEFYCDKIKKGLAFI